MKRKTWCLAAAVCMIAGSTLSTQAAEPAAVSGSWRTWFTGEKMESNFNREDILNTIGEMQPGDSVTFRIAVENQDKENTNWYMRNQVLESLEKKGSPASGGAYTYHLAYQSDDGEETVFFDSDSVGGEDSEEGLREATSSMEEWFFMDNLAPSRSGNVVLTVALDGETQGNAYQNTLAELELAFAVEPDAAAPTDREDPGSGGGSSGGRGSGGSGGSPSAPASLVYTPGTVQTNDTSQLMLWSAMTLACGLLLMAFGFICYRRERGGHGDDK